VDADPATVSRPAPAAGVPRGFAGRFKMFAAHGAASRVLGLIVTAAVMAAAGELGTVGDVAASVLIGVVVYWIAESYSRTLEARLVEQGTWHELWHELRDHSPMVGASLLPLLAMLATVAAGARDSVAITVGLATATLLLLVFAWIAAGTSGLSGLARIWTTVLVGAFGVAMIAMKAYVHSPRHH
jgi:hypothetical protein